MMFQIHFLRNIRRFSSSTRQVIRNVKQTQQLQFVQRTLHNVSSAHLQNVKNVYLVDETSEISQRHIQSGSNRFTCRTYNCGELRLKHVGERVTLCGWLEYQRMNKFVVIRDGYGHTQLLVDDKDIEVQKLLSTLPYESVIKISGSVVSRPKDMINPRQSTGEIEVLVSSFEILNKAKEILPFNIREFQKAKEALRMQYRYLDLRFSEMQKNMRIRSQFFMSLRTFLVNECQFVDVETPTLFKATPGGAQEFIVPTRFPGQFYSLVQSPQQFKQMLMAGAIDRYFQIARCYRDEGSRSDRQPEFTQLDIEMSFTDVNGVIRLIEELLHYSWPECLPNLPRVFPRIAYEDAMETYGTDKPDTRFEFTLHNCTNALKNNENLVCDNFGAYFLVFPEPYVILSKAVKERFSKLAQKYSESKFLQNKVDNIETWLIKLSRLLGNSVIEELKIALQPHNNSAIFFGYGNRDEVLSLLGLIRLEYVNILEEQGHKIKKDGMHPIWITDFPLFEKGDTPGSLNSAHHPFTSPHHDDVHLLESSPLKVRAQAYDLVLNGNEVGGGSIRIHDPAQQERIFKMLDIDKQFMQHMLDMLGSGCPPHGGIALGLDRLLATMLNTKSIRDVIAFPKTFEGRDPVSGAPSPISEHDKKLYHLEIVDNKS
ncbi:hypothetical protein ILUMI_00764 [Ignelater luminosus]|uniref:Aminoacyl-transfer RNA synthetases class-II family profile domain-containing protein n=1 Tax=Ignelater luminosus TaxID=2038154 RepID=A0A8K0GKX0_IGNLU|nr:hypothetical protein ILUMI_00764 [Ignelater luminosus]